MQFLFIILFIVFPRISFSFETKSIPCKNNESYPVHLSFDDGPNIPLTLKILDTLKKHNIKATFLISTAHFPSLSKIPPAPLTSEEKKLIDVVHRIQSEGHQIGAHSYEHMEHANPSTESKKSVDANLQKNLNVLENLGISTQIPFRFPYGSGWFSDQDSRNQAQADSVVSQIKSQGFTPYHWDIDSWDWSKIKRKALPQSVLHQICSHKGGTVLMHDIQPTTAANLDSLIFSIQKSGHKLVSYPEIKKYSLSKNQMSFADHTVGIFYCDRPVSDLDAIWPDCNTYYDRSYDLNKGIEQ